MPRRLIELSHQIRHGLVTYPGLPGPEISDYLPTESSPDPDPGVSFADLDSVVVRIGAGRRAVDRDALAHP